MNDKYYNDALSYAKKHLNGLSIEGIESRLYAKFGAKIGIKLCAKIAIELKK